MQDLLKNICFGGTFSKISELLKKHWSNMLLSRVGRKSETDKFFLGLDIDVRDVGLL